jgi:hypothetical protein
MSSFDNGQFFSKNPKVKRHGVCVPYVHFQVKKKDTIFHSGYDDIGAVRFSDLFVLAIDE